MAPWKLPVIVAAIAVPIAAAFYLGGPGVGVAAGALVGVAIVIFAVRQQPRGPIGEAPARSGPRKLLVVVAGRREDPGATDEVKSLATGEVEEGAEVMVLAPARIGFLDRWASDVEGARREAQERLVVSVASLAAAGVEAEARVGDEDIVQAVEDQLGSFRASDVVLVTAGEDEDADAAEAARELENRLRAEFHWIRVSGRGAR